MNLRKKIRGFFTLTRKANGGFTLVELVVVIAILAILAGAAVPAYSGYINKANEAADQQLLAALNTAYASACAAEGESHIGRTDVSSIKLEDGLIPPDYNMTSNAGIDSNFDLFFQDGQFKRFEILTFNNTMGVFTGNKSLAEALLNVWTGNGNSFAAGGKEVVQMLLGTMDHIEGYLNEDMAGLVTLASGGLVDALGFVDMFGENGTLDVKSFTEDAKNRTAQEVLEGATSLLELLSYKDMEVELEPDNYIDCYAATLSDDAKFPNANGEYVSFDELLYEDQLKLAEDNLGFTCGDLELSAEQVVVITGMAEELGLKNSAGVSGLAGMYALAAGYYNSDYSKDSTTKPSAEQIENGAYGQFGTVLGAMSDGDKWNQYLKEQGLKDVEAYMSVMGYLSEGEFGEGDTFTEEGYEWIADALGMK